jgi:hypothetical protein
MADTVIAHPEMALIRSPAFHALPKMLQKREKSGDHHQRHQHLIGGLHGVAQLYERGVPLEAVENALVLRFCGCVESASSTLYSTGYYAAASQLPKAEMV